MKNDKNIALEFNEFSKNYTNDMIRCVPRYLDLVSSFGKYFPAGFKPEKILDLGCGNGNTTAQLLAQFPDAAYTLVDASKEMLEICRNQFQDFDMSYSNSYFEEFQFEHNQYDLITAGLSLHHCRNKERQIVFSKIHSSLRESGIFAYSDLMISKTNPDHPALLQEWGAYVNSNFPDGEKWAWVMDHYATFDNPTDYKLQLKWLNNAGFSSIEIPFRDGYWIYLQAEK
ncbi:class I SAM-dependent methyltransferase [Christiangramia sabulilitoris]|uniref:Class I SAM-dependent methyltransferase n=1 Tax=Christiangramia sabulilitoris TaxID=2583991 RepID=A0A550I795_9FLAO|nr:class I SAM-dependent methyltransferase [Christiangramia sabulilitoris]TRO66843.1 class I SAM-dependent methyltransferase [Christiangramia sabulilitoris]